MRSTPAVLLCAVALLAAACGAGAPRPEGTDAVSAPSAAGRSSLRVERTPEGGDAVRTGPAPDRQESGAGAPDPGPSSRPSSSPAPAPSSPSAAPAQASPEDAGPREATRADAARFLAEVQPSGVRDLDGVAVDLDGDGTHELVLSGVRDDHGWLGLAAWDGRAYRVVTEGRGGPGDHVVQVSVADVNGDDLREVVLEVAGDGAGSLALWGVPSRVALVPLRARGGCHDGSHVYGAVGARLVPGPTEGVLDVAATCDEAPLPRADWSTQRWSWDGEAYRHVPEGPGGGAPGGGGNGNGPPPDTPRGGPDAEGD